jgi:probable O-glycosylation ligase (exosortase A-associated)
MGARDILVLGFFACSLPVCFFRPFYGVLMWAVVAFLNPHRFAWQTAQNFPIALMVAIPTLLGFIAFSNDWRSLRTREFALLVALAIWFTITTLASVNTPMFMHHAADTWERWNFVSKVLLMTGVTIAVVNNFSRLRILVLVMTGCFGLLVAKALPFIIITGGAFRLFGPEKSMIGDNNDLGLALNMTLPMFFFLARTEEKPWVKRLFGFLFVATVPAIFCTYSRGALVGLAIVSFLMFLQLKERWLLLPVGAMALVIVLLLAPPAWKERMNPTREGQVDGSAMGRLNAWTYATNLAMVSPITGGGFATFTPQLYSRYGPPGAVPLGSHSVYFGLLAEQGFVGLGLYLTLVVCCLGTTHKLIKWGRYYGDQRIVNYATMFRFSLLAFLASGMFLGRAYFDYYFTIVGCLAVLKHVAFREWSEAAQTPEREEEEQDSSSWRASHAV